MGDEIDWSATRVLIGRNGYIRCPSDWRLNASFGANLSDYDLMVFRGGEGVMTLGRSQHVPLGAGTALWLRPGGVYEGRHDPRRPLEVYAIHFDLTPRPAASALPPERCELADPEFVEAAARRVVELAQCGRDAAASELMRCLLIDIAEGPGRRRAASAAHRLHVERLEPAARRLRDAEAAPPTVAELAQLVGYSEGHFTRSFRAVFGESPRDYAITHRMLRARRLLSESSLTVSEIADRLGYGSVYFFSRQFRQRVGVTPTRYRRGGATEAGGVT